MEQSKQLETAKLMEDSRGAIFRLFAFVVEAERTKIFDGFNPADIQQAKLFFFRFRKSLVDDQHPLIFAITGIVMFSILKGSMFEGVEESIVAGWIFFYMFIVAKLLNQWSRSKKSYITSLLGNVTMKGIESTNIFYVDLLRYHIFGGKEKSGFNWKKISITTAIGSALFVALLLSPAKPLVSAVVLFTMAVNFLKFYEE